MPLQIFIYLYKENRVYKGTIFVEVADNGVCARVKETLAAKKQIPEESILLWKPCAHLNSSGGGSADLRDRLLDNDCRLDRFCDQLIDTELVGDIFPTSDNHHKAAPFTLVAEVIPMERTATLPENMKGELAEQRDVLGALGKKLDIAVKNVLGSMAPSENAKSTNYFDHQGGVTPILDGRYGLRRTPIPPPIELYNCVFASFQAYIRDESLNIPAQVVQLTAEVMRTVSQISPDESARQSPTRNILSKLLNSPVFQNIDPNNMNSAYILQFQRRSPPIVAAGVICEEKAELGWDGEGSVQGSFSYAQYWTQKDIQREHIFKACCCPSFIISIAGPWIVILGAVFRTLPIVQRLTDYLWLGNSRANDDDHALRLARVFQSVRLAIDNLEKYYQELELTDSPSIQPTRFFPDVTEYDDGTNVVGFQYLQPLEIDETCMTFLAQIDEAHGEEQVVVKFVQRYGAEAHRLLASKGKAPAPKYCGPISNNSKYWYGSLQMVVMEFLPGQTVAQKYEGSIPETLREAVRGAVRILHDQSFVHGDIRTPNIVIVDGAGDEGERMRIVDFDWAGEQGEVRYPLHLSDYIRSTCGVKDYDIITFQHDMQMVDAL
ncbi:uncharacterized protein EV420DRAFT_394133 [Desarmillaria tabescens]|uniref:Uncharacterized protein n=1 Tax=Armillaria tabescens TaxID=1929756 RepID=A0AA39N4Z5_ARMTA|nr:uncharacterized protein EV420DRAFT_394133 [Desarmillaria tabescens]KAK0458356.1 hypothetical protein EV420DRAFT_394133 [Desarmillaria tabescens]